MADLGEEAFSSSNVWATYSGTGRTLYFTDSSIIIADPEADPSKVEKPFVIKGLSTEKVDVGEMKNLTIHHPAETIRIAICDTCGADITDDIEGHKKSTGHPWYHYDAKVVKEAWDETVTVN